MGCQPVNTEDIAPPVEDIGEVAPTVEDVAPPGDAVEEEKPAAPEPTEREEVDEPVIVPVENTITGTDGGKPQPDDEEEPEEAPKTGASTGGVSSLRAEGLIVAVFASFLALLV